MRSIGLTALLLWSLPALAGDWRADLQVAVAAMDADLVAEVEAQTPTRTRAGFLRVIGPGWEDPALQPWYLEQVLDDDVDPAWQAAFAEQLARQLVDEPSSPWHEAWVELASTHPEARVREVLLTGLRHAPLALVEVGMVPALRHEHAPTRRMAALEIGMSNEASLASEVRPLLDDADAGVRGNAARTLGIFKDAGAVAGLMGLLNDENGEVRLHALRAVHRIDALRARELAPALVNDSEARVARLADKIVTGG